MIVELRAQLTYRDSEGDQALDFAEAYWIAHECRRQGWWVVSFVGFPPEPNDRGYLVALAHWVRMNGWWGRYDTNEDDWT